MNIYLITIGTLGLIGLIKIRRVDQVQLIERKNNYIECWQNIHESTKEYIFINVIYKLLYIFSLCQIRYNKMSKYFNLSYKNKITNKILLLLDDDGIIISNLDLDDIKYSDARLLLIDDKNVVFYEKYPDSFDYKVSQIHFINVELVYNDIIYPLQLKTSSVNYYIVNNSLNTFFIQYYIRNVLKIPIDEIKPFEYKLNIIDHNVNCFTLTQEQCLTFTETGYIK